MLFLLEVRALAGIRAIAATCHITIPNVARVVFVESPRLEGTAEPVQVRTLDAIRYGAGSPP